MPSPIDAVGPLDPQVRAALDAQLVREVFPAGSYLLRAGAPSRRLGVVRRGVVREYFALPDGVERTKAFAVEGDFVGSLPDALARRPSVCTIVAETDAEVLVCPTDAFLDWLHASDSARSWGLALLERLYVSKADRERELVGMDAWGRYQAFRQRFPGLEARVSQRVVASYVGITPEHLSRMRSRARRAS